MTEKKIDWEKYIKCWVCRNGKTRNGDLCDCCQGVGYVPKEVKICGSKRPEVWGDEQIKDVYTVAV